MSKFKTSSANRAKFIKAAKAAKKDGTWTDALKAAQKAGYHGTLHKLQSQLRPKPNRSPEGPRQHRARPQHG